MRLEYVENIGILVIVHISMHMSEYKNQLVIVHSWMESGNIWFLLISGKHDERCSELYLFDYWKNQSVRHNWILMSYCIHIQMINIYETI